MTRRDLNLIARAISNLALADDRRAYIALSFANSFAAAGLHIDRGKFFASCGVELIEEEN